MLKLKFQFQICRPGIEGAARSKIVLIKCCSLLAAAVRLCRCCLYKEEEECSVRKARKNVGRGLWASGLTLDERGQKVRPIYGKKSK